MSGSPMHGPWQRGPLAEKALQHASVHVQAQRGMKREGEPWRFTRHRRGRWLNNRVEQDHRRVKRLTRPMLGFQSFRPARRTLAGVEAIAMLTKGPVPAVPGNDMPAQRVFVHQIFGLAA